MDFQQDLPLCTACGTLFHKARKDDKHCQICDDPRQFILPAGQSWTTLRDLRASHKNKFVADPVDPRITSIYTEPKFAIGQRAILLETTHGNVLWDCISLLDQETVDFINSKGKGGLAAIVISHPHFYTSNAVWEKVFGCPVVVASEDLDWMFSRPDNANLRPLIETQCSVVPGITAIKCGGHFPGSMCLHWERMLFTSDTLMTVPSSRNPDEHYTAGETSTYSFMWSIPNMIPLGPAEVGQILDRLKGFEFEATFGNIPGLDVRKKDLKRRVLDSAQIQVKRMGWQGKEEGEAILKMKWD